MKNKLRIFCVFLCCLFLISIIICFGYSKYKYVSNSQIQTEVAEPILEIVTEYTDCKNIGVLNNDKLLYEFEIRNFNANNDISDVKIKYKMEFILSQNNAPITIDLYKINESGEEKINLQNNYTIEYEVLSLEKNTNLYRAEIVYDKSSDICMEEDLEISLNVYGEQGMEVEG